MNDMKLYVLPNGMNIGSIKNDLVATDDPDERFNFPSWTALIKHPDGNILFDAACHLDPERQMPMILENLRMTAEDHPVYRCRQAGVEPENVRYILLSHMHPDHFGYLDCFPNAEIIVSDDEFTYMMREYALGLFPFTKDVRYFIDKRLKWSLFPSDVQFRELLPGVTIVNFGKGHSYGMLGLLVELENDGSKLLISDVIYTAENVGPPEKIPGICKDLPNWRKSKEYALSLAKERNAQLWYGHDLAQFESLRKVPEYYS